MGTFAAHMVGFLGFSSPILAWLSFKLSYLWIMGKLILIARSFLHLNIDARGKLVGFMSSRKNLLWTLVLKF